MSLSAKRYKVIFAVFAFLSAGGPSAVQGRISEKANVLRICADLYGPPADDKLHIFAINQFYVLSVTFDQRDKLRELAVEPRYFFEDTHPDWAEPDNFTFLSKVQYEELLVRLDAIKPKGALVTPSSASSAVTNMTAHHKATYRRAVLEWGELVDLRRGENPPLQVRWVRLHYLM